MPAEPAFVHLHVHSSYSLLEGALTIARLAELAKNDRQPALALTDTDNMFGALEFSEKLASFGIQPIVGCTIAVDFGDIVNRSAERNWPRLVLLATDESGYRSLMRLCSRAYLETAAQERPHIKITWLDETTDGLIALCGGPHGPLDGVLVAGQHPVALSRCQQLQRLFGDRLYIELQRHGMAGERLAEPQLIDLAYSRGLPLVATIEIAQRCMFRPRTQAPILPRFAAGRSERAAANENGERDQQVQEAAETEELRRAARSGLERRLQCYGTAPGHSVEDYNERLEFELGVIVNMHYAGYFLIVADFIQWAKAQDIPVGPGRGSGAGSLVAWALTITDLDPMRFGLLFERFLNPERISMPDFDVDFCQDRRDEVIRYVQQKY